MKTVFVLQHSYEIGGHDETKFIGVYSSQGQANLAVNRLKEMPGFRDRQENFEISEYEIDKDHWTEGYASMIGINVPSKTGGWTTVQAECLPNKTYKIHELYENDLLGQFKHLDIVECEERDNLLYAIKLAKSIQARHPDDK